MVRWVLCGRDTSSVAALLTRNKGVNQLDLQLCLLSDSAMEIHLCPEADLIGLEEGQFADLHLNSQDMSGVSFIRFPEHRVR